MSCRVCVSVAASSPDDLVAALQHTAGADLVELRLDALAEPDRLDLARLATWVEASPVRVVYTCRPRWEGGGYDGPEPTREALLRAAARSGAAYVDVEVDAAFASALVAEAGCGVILSHHWSAPRPADLEARCRQLVEIGPAIAKLVAPADCLADSLPLIDAGKQLVSVGQPATAFCMNEAGRPSRALVARYGGALTYAAARAGSGSAPGQLTLAELIDDLLLPSWPAGARACGLIGDPIAHSLSPRILNAAFVHAGLPFCYVPLPSADIDDALRFAEALGFRGLSVTMPFKQEALARCKSVHPLARRIGAANTLMAGPEGWEGRNTDALAVVESIAAVRALEGSRVTILGAGGAARAAAVALAEAGATIEVLNRTASRAAEVAAIVRGTSGSLSEFGAGRRDIVVNATPVGMSPDPVARLAAADGGRSEAGAAAISESPAEARSAVQTAVPTAELHGDEVVLDMVYRPLDTALLRGARERGCVTVSGLEMLTRQAAEQFRLWTGETGSLDTMLAAAQRQS